MKFKNLLIASVLPALAAVTISADPNIEHKPLAIGALQEIGQLKSGVYGGGSNSFLWVEDDWVDRFGAFITKEVIINERLLLSAGLGGTFQFRKPELVNASFSGHQRKGFFVGPSQTQVVYTFGDLENPFLKLGAGMFGYKYNPEAANLGEYLFRTLPYPTSLFTGGYTINNSSAAWLQGARANFRFGDLGLDLLVTTETGLAPLYDWSIAAVADYSMAEGLLVLGAGVNLKRIIPVNKKRTAPKEDMNGYFSYNGVDYSTNTDYYFSRAAFYGRLRDNASGPDSAAVYNSNDQLYNRIDSIAFWIDDINRAAPGAPQVSVDYYNAAGTILMGRAAVDFKKILGDGPFGPQDLKLFAEAALLGVKNYPVFYTKRSERTPIMVGLNLPTFKLLDLLCVQIEVFDSPNLNNTYQIGQNLVNVPYFPSPGDTVFSKTAYADITDDDNLKWSVVLKRQILPGMTLSAQAACDHLRLTSGYYYYGPQLNPNEITMRTDDWYWAVQIGWGI